MSVPKGWSGAAYATNSGRFSHCVANARYKSNFNIFVSIDGDFYWKVAFLDRRKRLRNGRAVARIKIDGSRWSSYRTQVTKNNFFVLNMPGNSSFIRLFRRGRRLRLDIDGADYLFNLTNTNALLPALARCVKKYVRLRGKPPRRTARKTKRNSNNSVAANTPGQAPVSELRKKTEKNRARRSSAGTGMVVSKGGHVLTNFHVVRGCKQIAVTMLGELEAEAKLLKADKKNDLAVLKIGTPVPDKNIAQFRVGRRLKAGEAIAVYGFPLPGTLSVSGNIVSGHITSLAGLGDDARFVQISSPIQPGNSGGPLIDSAGQIIGVVTAKLDELKFAGATGSMPQNVNFAIKSNIALNFMDAHSIPYKTSSSQEEHTLTKLVEEAKNYTVHVKCN
ncbi:MAG: serine protease [Alphaproteobacteria bacterium]|nr:serine protease [Alphaproteobacteria bacterium]